MAVHGYRRIERRALRGPAAQAATLLELRAPARSASPPIGRGAAELSHLPKRRRHDRREQGRRQGLEALPNVGRGIAAAIVECMAHRPLGPARAAARQRRTVHLFTLLPGLGRRLAERIHDELPPIRSGARLAARRPPRERARRRAAPAAAIRREPRGALSRGRLRRSAGTVSRARTTPPPPVEELLDVDRRYRDGASRDPGCRRSRRSASIRASLAARAAHDARHHALRGSFRRTPGPHQLNRTRDWVVLCDDDRHLEGQCTIVTETHGPLAGRRVVRDREASAALTTNSRAGRRSGTTRSRTRRSSRTRAPAKSVPNSSQAVARPDPSPPAAPGRAKVRRPPHRRTARAAAPAARARGRRHPDRGPYYGEPRRAALRTERDGDGVPTNDKGVQQP